MTIDLKRNEGKRTGMCSPFYGPYGDILPALQGAVFVLSVPKQDIIFRVSVLKMVYKFV